MADDSRLDGNAAAGLLAEIFGADMTLAEGTCANCGNHGPLAEVHVYANAPGTVLRCSRCEQVLMTIVRAGDRAYLDLSGTRRIQIALT